jgi:hypothetical protein
MRQNFIPGAGGRGVATFVERRSRRSDDLPPQPVVSVVSLWVDYLKSMTLQTPQFRFRLDYMAISSIITVKPARVQAPNV